jgi:O-acetyl-ADP-ribose deacetylase (regulator of RNase III)
MAASFSKLRPLAEIPTLSQLYRSGKLTPSALEDLPTASQKLNDTICHVQHDITKLQVDAIVNAANESLLGGGGIDGAIHRAAGRGLLRECHALNGCDTGSAKITDAYDLPCKKVIHAVGPVYRSIEKSEPLLRSCYRTLLQLAVQNGCKSIALCGISTGIYGYPSMAAAQTALREVRAFLTLTEEGHKLEKVVFCSYNYQDVASYMPNLP